MKKSVIPQSEGRSSTRSKSRTIKEPLVSLSDDHTKSSESHIRSRPKRGLRQSNYIEEIEEKKPKQRDHKSEKKASSVEKIKRKSFKKAVISPKKDKKKRVSTVADLDAVRSQLLPSAIPDRLPCREEEFDIIRKFVQRNVISDLSGSLYISGVPGTGKTATVHQVMRLVIEMSYKKKLAQFTFIEVNGMRVTEPNQVFCEIGRQLDLFDGKRVSVEAAVRRLNRYWQSDVEHRLPVVLLVDELDLLCTRRQNVLYQLFDWAIEEYSKLSVLAIANTLDLPERLLTHRVSSRLGMSRLCFQPYTFQQIGSILHSRLSGLDGVESDAVQLVSRKVAAVSGDLRKALQICQRATEIAMKSGKYRLTLAHVQSAVKDLSTTPRLEALRRAPLHQQLLLRALVAEHQRTGYEEAEMSTIKYQYDQISNIEGVEPLSIDQLMHIAAQLCSYRLLVSSSVRGEWTRKLRLNLPADDVTFALNVGNN